MGLHITSVASERYSTTRRLEDDVRMANEVLGTGMSGAVRRGTRLGSRVRCAVKSFPKGELSKQSRADVANEIELYMRMDHPHIARLENVYENEAHVHLVMECLEGGEVFQRVFEDGRFSEKRASRVLRQMLLAVSYLHRRNIVHRDLKCENFMFETNGGDHVKLIDFGLAKHWDGRKSLREQCGTLMYMAPEVLRRSYTTKADMWSLGVIAYILLTGSSPFPSDKAETRRMLKAGKPHLSPSRFGPLSKTAKDFVRRLLHADPAERLSAQEALRHPWIRAQEQTPAPDEQLIRSLRDFAQLSPLRRACLSVAAWSVSRKEQARARGQFLALDRNNDGAISVDELTTALVPRGVPKLEVERLFACLDRNRDGEVAFSEFLVACALSLDDAALCSTFKKLDVNGDGRIGLSDLSQVFSDDSDGSLAAQELLREMESCEDGAISFQEFCAFLRSPAVPHGSITSASTDTSASSYDHCNDGFVDGGHCLEARGQLLKQTTAFTKTRNVFARNGQKPKQRRLFQCFFGRAREC